MTSPVVNLISSPNSRVYRRAFLKRRESGSGLFESDWFEFTDDVESFGALKKESDVLRPGIFKFSGAKIKVSNDDGKYNDFEDGASIWFGYSPEQRTIIKINYGFLNQTKSGGVWTNQYLGEGTLWGSAIWGASVSVWGDREYSFYGLLSGDISRGDDNSVFFNIRPLTQVFVDFPASKIDGFTSTGLSASQFVKLLRDQTDGSGNFVFRPFFRNTSTGWAIEETSVVYPGLNTSGSNLIATKSTWDIIEDLCEAENYLAYVAGDGSFHFEPKTISEDYSFKFIGSGFLDSEFGKTIKSFNFYAPKIQAFYSRIQVKFSDEDTTASYYVKETSFEVNAASTPWNYGYRTLQIDNPFIDDSATAQSLADALFLSVGRVRKELQITTSFVPGLNLLDRVLVYNDSGQRSIGSLWDVNDWDTELEWDSNNGDSLYFNGKAFGIFSVEENLDNLECKFILREI